MAVNTIDKLQFLSFTTVDANYSIH